MRGEEGVRVLFIGNSHTYANGLPFQVRGMVNHALGEGVCEAWMVATGGKSLGWHAGEPATQMAIRCHPWDFIVLQQATHPFGGYETLAEDYGRLAPYLGPTGATVLMYETWSRKASPGDQEELSSAFRRLSGEFGLRLVPAGTCWHRASREWPHVDLYAADGGHASPAGTYLSACAFFGVLTDRPPEGLPSRVAVGGDILVELKDEDAAVLQRIARAVLAEEGLVGRS